LSLRLAVYTLFGKNKIKFGQKYSASPKTSTPVTCGVILHAHPVRGESHIQRNANREVAAVVSSVYDVTYVASFMGASI